MLYEGDLVAGKAPHIDGATRHKRPFNRATRPNAANVAIDPCLLHDRPKFAGAQKDLLEVWLYSTSIYFNLIDLHQSKWVSLCKPPLGGRRSQHVV